MLLVSQTRPNAVVVRPHVMFAELQAQNHYKTHVHTYLCPIVFERGKRVEKASVVNGLKFVEY